jgi:hypothetical protein
LKDDVPVDMYTLPIQVNISGKDSQGTEVLNSGSDETFIQERPTPTPRFLFMREGVTLEIPGRGIRLWLSSWIISPIIPHAIAHGNAYV